jgi:hypothetical protein
MTRIDNRLTLAPATLDLHRDIAADVAWRELHVWVMPNFAIAAFFLAPGLGMRLVRAVSSAENL